MVSCTQLILDVVVTWTVLPLSVRICAWVSLVSGMAKVLFSVRRFVPFLCWLIWYFTPINRWNRVPFLPHPVSDCYDRAAPMWLSVTLVKTRFMYGGFYVAHFCGDIRQSGSRPVVKKGITALPLIYNPSFKIQANKGMVITARHPRLSRRSLRFR